MTSSVSKSLSKIITFANDTLDQLPTEKEPKSLYRPIHHIVSNKGKQIRSILALLTYDMFGRDINDLKEIILAIEGLHHFTLIHDDVMDNSHLRRGEETINKKWSNNQAILSGDVLLIQSYQYLLASKFSNNVILKDFTNTAVLICEGQQLDLDFQHQKHLTKDQYFNMIRLKTGMLIAFSLVAPSLLTSFGKKNVVTMRSIGELLGDLFQIQDDYLDLYGDTLSLGKVIGGDILEMKKTFLYVTAFHNANSIQKKELVRIYHGNYNDRINEVISLYDNLNVAESVQDVINKLSSRLTQLIGEIDVLESKKEAFIEYVNIILKRKH